MLRRSFGALVTGWADAVSRHTACVAVVHQQCIVWQRLAFKNLHACTLDLAHQHRVWVVDVRFGTPEVGQASSHETG